MRSSVPLKVLRNQMLDALYQEFGKKKILSLREPDGDNRIMEIIGKERLAQLGFEWRKAVNYYCKQQRVKIIRDNYWMYTGLMIIKWVRSK